MTPAGVRIYPFPVDFLTVTALPIDNSSFLVTGSVSTAEAYSAITRKGEFEIHDKKGAHRS